MQFNFIKLLTNTNHFRTLYQLICFTEKLNFVRMNLIDGFKPFLFLMRFCGMFYYKPDFRGKFSPSTRLLVYCVLMYCLSTIFGIFNLLSIYKFLDLSREFFQIIYRLLPSLVLSLILHICPLMILFCNKMIFTCLNRLRLLDCAINVGARTIKSLKYKNCAMTLLPFLHFFYLVKITFEAHEQLFSDFFLFCRAFFHLYSLAFSLVIEVQFVTLINYIGYLHLGLHNSIKRLKTNGYKIEYNLNSIFLIMKSDGVIRDATYEINFSFALANFLNTFSTFLEVAFASANIAVHGIDVAYAFWFAWYFYRLIIATAVPHFTTAKVNR